MLSRTYSLAWIAILTSSFTTSQAASSCKHVFYETGAIISSENFPDTYPSSHTCTWEITVKTGERVSLRFLQFDTEESSDYVRVYTDLTAGSSCSQTPNYIPPSSRSYSGNTLPDVKVSTSNYMCLFFATKNQDQRRGFTGVLTTDGHSLNLTAPSETIQSPLHPDPFPPSSLFTWSITVGIGDIIVLEFHNFTVNDCRNYIRAYDGNTSYALLLGHLNDCNPPVTAIRSTGNEMFIVFGHFHGNDSNFVGNYTSHCANSCLGEGFQRCDQICRDMNETFECSCHEGFNVSAADSYKCQECDEWTYGMACSNSCHCNINTTDYCNKTDGTCVCNYRWNGINCSMTIDSSTITSTSNQYLYDEPVLDEKTSGIIIGILGFLLLALIIAFIILLCKCRRGERKNRNSDTFQPMTAPSLNDVNRRSYSHTDPSDASNEYINSAAHDSMYETPVSLADAKKREEPRARAGAPNNYEKFPRFVPQPSKDQTATESELYGNIPASNNQSVEEKEDSVSEEIYQNT